MTNLGDMASAGKQYGVRFILPQGEDSNGVVEAPNGIATPESSLDHSETGRDKGGERPDSDNPDLLNNPEETRRTSETVSRKGLATSRHNVNNKPPVPANETGSPPSAACEPDLPGPSTPQPGLERNKPHRYCRHWVRNGWCPYDASCHFKHAMPGTAGGLRSVGLQGSPQWLLDYMHTERLPEIPHREMRTGLKKSGLPGGEGEEDGMDVEGMMSPEVAKGKARQDDHDKGGKGKLANKATFKGKGKGKWRTNGDLIDLL